MAAYFTHQIPQDLAGVYVGLGRVQLPDKRCGGVLGKGPSLVGYVVFYHFPH